MEPDKYYVITDQDDPYENCLNYRGPFDTLKEARKEAEELKSSIWSAQKKPFYSSVTVVKTIKF